MIFSWSKTKILSWYPFRIEGYLFSFYWLLDLVSIISLFPDVDWIAEPLDIRDTNGVAKAGQVVRLVRLIRLVRVYKIASDRRKRIQEEEDLLALAEYGIIDYDDIDKHRQLNSKHTSKLGAQLSESITQKVIIIVLVMIIVLPLLTYTSRDESSEFAMKSLHAFNIDPTLNDATKQAALEIIVNYTDSYNINYDYLLQLEMKPFVDGFAYNSQSRIDDIPDEFKHGETFTFLNETTGEMFITRGTFTTRYLNMLASQYSIILIVFVGFMLIAGAIRITADAQKLVLTPIERMMNMVDVVAQNPLKPLNLSYSTTAPEKSNEKGGAGGGGRNSVISTMSELDPRSSTAASFLQKGKKKKFREGDYETRLLETTIEKVTGLLRVGFGEAGANIISTNLSDRNAMINPLLPGVRVYAIFGFCDIHRFEEGEYLYIIFIFTNV